MATHAEDNDTMVNVLLLQGDTLRVRHKKCCLDGNKIRLAVTVYIFVDAHGPAVHSSMSVLDLSVSPGDNLELVGSDSVKRSITSQMPYLEKSPDGTQGGHLQYPIRLLVQAPPGKIWVPNGPTTYRNAGVLAGAQNRE